MKYLVEKSMQLLWQSWVRALTWTCLIAMNVTGPTLVHAYQESPELEKARREKIRFFEKSVRPILLANCSKCHGSEKQESGLRIDHISFLQKGGDSGPAVIPGKPDESLLVKAIEHSDFEMPPSEELPAHQINAIRKWILDGAHWPTETIATDTKKWKEHWAFQKISTPVPPEIDSKNLHHKNEIDQFILDRIVKQNLAPADRADEFTLVRRAYHDLHGIGPTYLQASKYLADERPDRFEKLIEQLLESPRYGEKQARKWMDIARYADNKGYVFFEDKNYPWAYTYRDWLIRSFNDDMPFDEFIGNQLAADQIATKNNNSNLPALGFLTVGAKFVNNVHDQIDDRIDVVMRGMMGLTVSCARCHDHKFDPVPQSDYYALYGVFRSCYEPVVLPTFEAEPTTTEYLEYKKGLNERLQELEQFIEAQRKQIMDGARSRISEYLMAVHQRRHHPPTENFMTITDKGSLIPKVISRYEIYLTKTAKNEDPIWSIWHALSALDDRQFPEQADIVLREKLKSQPGINSVVRKQFSSISPKSMQSVADVYGDIFKQVSEQYQRDPSTLNEDQLALANVLFGKNSPAVLPSILGWGFLDLIPDRPTQAAYEKLLKDVEKFCKSGPHAPPRAMVVLDSDEPFQPYVFLRGNPSRKGKSIKRGFLTEIPNSSKFKTEFPNDQSGRLQLARSIASKDNPLTARVIVNRIWMQHFGKGLVETPSDFGLQGAKPTHPELLDWLSTWFINNGWSIKKLHKLIMSSATYQRSSELVLENLDSDPENKLLTRFNRRRLDFESMRDSMLISTGTIDTKIGGKSFELFNGFNTRRSLYGFINRMDLPGVLRTFDYPEPAATSAQREQTTVPAQALFFLNHPFVVQCAERILERNEIETAKSRAEKTKAIYRAVLGRDPNENELRIAMQFIPEESTAQPASVWRYGYGSYDAKTGNTKSFRELTHFTGTHWQGGKQLPDPKLNWLFHKKDESHPGASMDLCSIRRWVAPQDCTVNIRGMLSHEPTQGNGVNSKVISSRGGILGSWTVHHSKTETNIPGISVKAGDTIDFVSDFNSEIAYDQHKWSVLIETTEKAPTKWDSVKQFSGPKNSAWVNFAHALLMTNEFMFID